MKNYERPLIHLIVVIWIFALGTGSSLAAHQSSRKVKKILESKIQQSTDAYLRKDVDKLGANQTPDFTLVTLDGKSITSEQLKEGLAQRLQRITRFNYLRVKIKSLTVKDGTAVALTTQEFSRVITDPQGNEHTVLTRGMIHRETWVKIDGDWKVKRVEELTRPVETIDGQGHPTN
jgi:ketosteroid isomerase-like protein